MEERWKNVEPEKERKKQRVRDEKETIGDGDWIRD
jgi:hypothetical protein